MSGSVVLGISLARPLVIVSAFLPPHRGGLGDHTHCLATLFADFREVTVLTSHDVTVNPAASYSIAPLIRNWRDAAELSNAVARMNPEATWVWQYVPHMYGRGGVNRELPRLVRHRSEGGHRQVVIAHEIAADYSWRPHWSWYAWQHRRQWADLRHSGAFIAISSERWLLDWRQRDPSLVGRSCLLPSPSNMQPQPRTTGWRQALGWNETTRIVAFFGTLSAHKQLGFVVEGWRRARAAGLETALLIIGEKPVLKLSADEAPWFKALGYAPAKEAHQAISQSDLLALPFIDGVSERRSTLMAGLAAGTAVTATHGHMTGPTLRDAGFVSLTPAHDGNAFADRIVELLRDNDRRCKLGLSGRDAYSKFYSWEVVKQRLLPHLGN